MNETLSTERLFLQRITKTDAAFMHKLMNSPGWLRNIGDRNIKTVGDAGNYIEWMCTTDNAYIWTVTVKETNISIGIITLVKKDYLAFQDIGFAFLPDFEGKGYAYEAASLVVIHIEKHNIEAICAVTLPDNLRSITLLQKLGLKLQGPVNVQDEDLLYFFKHLST